MELYSVQPFFENALEAESLTGYLCRIAARHQATTQRLLNYLDDEFHTLVTGTYTIEDARSLNGCGQANRRILGALAQIYPNLDLTHLSFSDLGSSFAKGGMGLLKWDRHWCPMCFREDVEEELEAHERLLWQTAEIKICPKHGCLLESHCPQCGKNQHRMPSSGKLDSCHRCGAWLGRANGRLPAFGPRESAYQKWLCTEIPAVLNIKNELSIRQTGLECGAFIKATCRTRNLTPRELANALGISYERIVYAIAGKGRPKFSTWLQICANLNVSPALTLLDPLSAASQLPLELPRFEFARPQPTKAKRKRYDAEEILSILDAQLATKNPDYPSIKSLAKANQLTESAIYYHANSKAKKLADRLKNKRHKNAENTRRNLVRHGVAILVARHQEGLFTNRKTFILEMKSKTGISQHKASDLFTVCLSKARAKIQRSLTPESSQAQITLLNT